MKIVALAIALAMASAGASAHDVWSDGRPIPNWVKESCCGPADAHLMRTDQVHKVDGGWMIDGFPDVIPDDKVLPSEDGSIWAFWREYGAADGGRTYTIAYCLFLPMSF